jgi:phage anti-repressor protein
MDDTKTLISILNTIINLSFENALKRPRKFRANAKQMVCPNIVLCKYHERAKDTEVIDFAINWKLPEDPQDPLYFEAQKIMDQRNFKPGELVFARSRYIQNSETNVFECNNRVLIETAYRPEEEFLKTHFLVKFIDVDDNHTEWISRMDICKMTFDEKIYNITKSEEETWENTRGSKTEDIGEKLQSTKEIDIEENTSITATTAKSKYNNVSPNFTAANDCQQVSPTDEFEYVDDNIYCGNLTDFGLQRGGLILARCTKIKEPCPFHRGKIVDMHFQEVLGLHLRIFFFDYGNVEWVHILDTRIIPKEVVEFPPLAEEAALYDLYPTWIFEDNEEPSMHGWSRKACTQFMNLASIIESHDSVESILNTYEEYYVPLPLHHVAKDTRNKRKYVDLFHYPSKKLSKGAPISIRDLLLYCGVGCMADPREIYCSYANRRLNPSVELKSMRKVFEDGTFSLVKISHIESVEEIYVLPMNYLSFREEIQNTEKMLNRIGKELELFYEKMYSGSPYAIDTPIVGSLCAVKRYGTPGHRGSSNDVYGKRWYRCVIEHVPKNTRLAQVYLVDVGYRCMVYPRKNLYLLNTDRFVNRYKYALCFPIRLTNIKSNIMDNNEERRALQNKIQDCLHNLDKELGLGTRYDRSVQKHSLKEIKNALKDDGESMFVMPVDENKVTDSGCEDDVYPSVSLFREVTAWDRADDWYYDERMINEIERGILSINSILMVQKGTHYRRKRKDINNVEPQSNRSHDLGNNVTTVCSHPEIHGSLINWILRKLQKANKKTNWW